MDKILDVGVVGGVFLLLVIASSLAMMPQRAEIQPVAFNHHEHYDYFRSGDHARHHLEVHRDLIGDVPEELTRGACSECHGDLDEAAEETPEIKACAGCHEGYLKSDVGSRPAVRPCLGCHRGAVSGPDATIPGRSVCAECHEKPRTPSREEQKLGDYIHQSRAIPWVHVYDELPGDIVFSHERHVMLGKIDCQRCHGDVQDCRLPLTRRVTFRMEDCMECHEDSNASNDCLTCHR